MGVAISRGGVGRRIEFALIFVIGPVLFAWVIPYRFLFLAIWLVFFYALAALWQGGFEMRRLVTGWRKIRWRYFAVIYAISIAVFSALTYALFPERLFPFFALGRWGIWAAIIVLYPLLSAWPQEVIFRAFYFRRYDAILPKQGARLLNAALFSWAHLFYGHWVVFALTFVGGYIFAKSYLIHQRLAEATLFHALLGNLIFTTGLGALFYSGNLG